MATAVSEPPAPVEGIQEKVSGPLLIPLPNPSAKGKPVEHPALTEDQQKKYEWLLEHVKEWTEVPSAKEKTGPLTDNEKQWLTRECLLRYLRATKWHEKEAGKRLLDTLTWRRDYGVEINVLTPEHCSPENETGKQIILGYDKEGRPCHYLSPGRQNTEASPRQVQHLVFMLERVIEMMPAQVETLSLMIDYKPSKTRSNTNPGIAMAREVLNILQNHYPERLGKALIINTPWFVHGFFKIITPFIDPHTREKLKFNEDMTQYVPSEQLWTTFKGNLEFEYDHSVYWPALMKLCTERREARKQRWIAGGKHIGESEDYLSGHAATVNNPVPTMTSPNPPTTTKAWTYSKAKGLPRQVLTLTTTHPVAPFPPLLAAEANQDWLLLRVSYAALNPGDVVTMSVLPSFLRSGPAKTACVPTMDVSATVVDFWAAPGSQPGRTFAAGDSVVGFVTFDHLRTTGNGGLQEVVALPARFFVRVPQGKSQREAAGLLLAGCTAWQQVVLDYTRYGDLVGELATRYGGKPFDVIIDGWGNQMLFNHCARFLKPEGFYNAASIHYDGFAAWPVLVSGLTLLWNAIRPKSTWLGGTGRNWMAANMMDPGIEFMEQVVALFTEGKIRVVVDSEWSFEQVHEAFDVLISGRARGKVIVKVAE
ncbi:hypothetical protein B0H67DRAFT_484476 [Lasiosphaeris hirsuta]|uniref:CRAL-TRIO domain-containing protein n=1 Tax=Lasiosphaeris hirsuta TaxID=260670 RepID=A0AA40APJ2_9PEZI|nr:hypothetical protein B0H67DRAFT_484476 [Lasiosphaeris hirsuta]